MEELKAPVDRLGKEFKVGDYFVLATRRSSYLDLKVGRVVGMKECDKYVYPQNSIILLPLIRTTEDRCSEVRIHKASTMERPDNAIIVPAGSVPNKYLKVLDPLVVQKWRIEEVASTCTVYNPIL